VKLEQGSVFIHNHASCIPLDYQMPCNYHPVHHAHFPGYYIPYDLRIASEKISLSYGWLLSSWEFSISRPVDGIDCVLRVRSTY